MVFLLIFIASIKSFSQKNLDLTLDYYRALGVSLTTSLFVDKLTHNHLASGIIGLVAGSLQGLMLERGNDGKIVSCMGSFGGTFIFIPICTGKDKRAQRKLDTLKGKLD